ncbi:hypothetical protein JOQ06_009478 [Pogonophryne albipinna]|uniref:Uncharacterized protein n=1 Tax=Pogonophryne albipinna TaxID=1090488 RepID=A0AAD6FTK7_9TELE|nr:hypothetical protein JOQ06_009478 [Pogonophryne albipinna]
MESITLKVEEALERAADSDQKLNNLEGQEWRKRSNSGVSEPLQLPMNGGTGRGGCSELPGVKERLLLKKDMQGTEGREKEVQAPRIEDISEEKPVLKVTV